MYCVCYLCDVPTNISQKDVDEMNNNMPQYKIKH